MMHGTINNKNSLLNPVHLLFFHYEQALAFASSLDLSSSVVTIHVCTSRFHIKKFYVLTTLCVPWYGFVSMLVTCVEEVRGLNLDRNTIVLFVVFHFYSQSF